MSGASGMKIGIDGLQKAITQIYEEYGKSVDAAVDIAAEEVAKAGRAKVRQNAKRHGWKSKYVNGWQYKVEKTRLGTTAVIFNGSQPGLPHLLEFSHVVRHPYGNLHTRQTTSTAKPHVKSVESEVETEFIERIRKELNR